MQLFARDLMERNVLTIPAAMSFREIQHLFVVAGCHGAPVVDDAGNVLGIVSAMDLLRAADQAYDEDRDPGEDQDFDVSTLTATELATPEPVWVELDASALEIAQLMQRAGIHRVLVRQDGRLRGHRVGGWIYVARSANELFERLAASSVSSIEPMLRTARLTCAGAP